MIYICENKKHKMNILKNIFGSSENQPEKTSNVNWINLNDLGQLNEVQEISNQKPVLIFKHSTTCSVSRMALKNFEREFDLHDKVDTYFLDLLNHRDISNEIASRFQVIHQSPQLLLIKEGNCTYNVSHSSIEASELEEKL